MTFQQHFSYIVAISFCLENPGQPLKKAPTSRNLMANFITYGHIDYTSPH